MKITAGRMKGVLGKSISTEQFGFLLGRQITNAARIVEEALHYIKAKNFSAMVLKLDLEKAYDKVDRSFLNLILVQIGFPFKATQWIMKCINTTSFVVLINGSPLDIFKGTRGLSLAEWTILKDLSELFCRASGMTFNLTKSCFRHWGVEELLLSGVTDFFQICGDSMEACGSDLSVSTKWLSALESGLVNGCAVEWDTFVAKLRSTGIMLSRYRMLFFGLVIRNRVWLRLIWLMSHYFFTSSIFLLCGCIPRSGRPRFLKNLSAFLGSFLNTRY